MILPAIEKSEIEEERKEFLERTNISFRIYFKNFVRRKRIKIFFVFTFLFLLAYLVVGIINFFYFRDIILGIFYISLGFLPMISNFILIISNWLKSRGKIPKTIKSNVIFYRMRLFIVLSIIFVIILNIDAQKWKFNIFLMNFALSIFFFILTYIGMFFSISFRIYGKQSWYVFFMKHPYLNTLENKELIENITSLADSSQDFIFIFNKIFRYLKEFIEYYLYPTIKIKLKYEDVHRFYFAIINHEEIILNSFAITMKELYSGNFKEFYLTFHSFVQLLRSDNPEQPIKSFVFTHKRKKHLRFLEMIIRFFSNRIVTGTIVGIIIIVLTIYINSAFG